LEICGRKDIIEKDREEKKLDDIFKSYILPAIIAAVVALVSSVVTSIVAYKTTKQMIKAENERLKISLENSKEENAKHLSAEYISNERVRWIQEFRRNFADFRAHTTEVAFKSRANNSVVPDYSFEINREATYLKLLLKGYGRRELKIKEEIDTVISSLAKINGAWESMNDYFKAMDELTKRIQIYLKVEWERVKIEIAGSSWDNDLENRLFEENERLYNTDL